MSRGTVLEEGTLPDGTSYRVWKPPGKGKPIVYIGDHKGSRGTGSKRSLRWLKDVKSGKRKEKFEQNNPGLEFPGYGPGVPDYKKGKPGSR